MTKPQPSLRPDRQISPAQLALWAEQQITPNVSSSGYFAVTLGGPLDAGQLRAAVLAVLHRHEPLRSVLRLADGTLRQVVLSAADALSFATAELACEQGRETATVREWMRLGESRRRWDLAAEPPIHFHDLVHAPDRRTLVFSVHHAGFDGRSKFVVARDFAQYLGRVLNGTDVLPDPLPAAAPPEADEATCAAAASYWTCVLDGDIEPLVVQGGRSPGRTGVITSDSIALEPRHIEALGALAKRCGTSTFTTLVAALSGQLTCYGNTRSVLGLAADISDERTREVAGVQINVVPLLLEVAPSATAVAAVAAADAALRRLQRFRRVPFRRLLRALPDRSARRLMTQFGISFPRAPRGLVFDVPGLRCHWEFFTPNTSATFDKTLQIRADWPRCQIRLDYRPETMGAQGAAEFVDHFQQAIASLVEGPSSRFRPVVARAAETTAGGDLPELLRSWSAERAGRPSLVTSDGVLDHAALAAAFARGDSRLGPVDLVADLARLRTWMPSKLVILTAAALAVAGRSGVRSGELVVAAADTQRPALIVEAVATWLAGATFVIYSGGDLPRGRIRRLIGRSGDFPEFRAEVDRVLPLAELASSGAGTGAHYVVDDLVVGWVAPAGGLLDPPPITPTPGCAFTTCGPTGEALPAWVPGRLLVTGPEMEVPVDTGDRGRCTADGVAEYLGPWARHWLRHNGFIDVQLVERVLHAHPGVRAASVTLRTAGARGPVAVASVVPDDPTDPPTVGSVRAFLHEHLDGFDLPGRIEIVPVDRGPGSFPLVMEVRHGCSR